jgi:protein TonB
VDLADEKSTDPSQKRMVQTQKARKTSEAPDSKLLGEQNQHVERQTVSKERLVVTPKPGAPAQPTEQQKQANAEKATRKTQSKDLSKLGLAILPKVEPDVRESPFSPPKKSSGQDGVLAQDYVKGFEEGERTVLSTKEYVFFGYFQRIRERLDLAWNRRLQKQLAKIWRKGRSLAADMDHTTRLLVTLDQGGVIVRVQTIEESGTRDLDEAAIRAFNDAGPFPNPPQGIVDADGRIRIRWDFVLKT